MTNKSFCHIFYSVFTGMLVSYHHIYVRPIKTCHMYPDSKKVAKKTRGGDPPPTATLHLREGGCGGWLHPHRRGNGGGSNPDHLCGGGEIHPCTPLQVWLHPIKVCGPTSTPMWGWISTTLEVERPLPLGATPTAWSYPPLSPSSRVPPLSPSSRVDGEWREGWISTPSFFFFVSLSLFGIIAYVA